MDTSTLIQLPDGSYALISRTATWGEVLIVLILVAILFIECYRLWKEH